MRPGLCSDSNVPGVQLVKPMIFTGVRYALFKEGTGFFTGKGWAKNPDQAELINDLADAERAARILKAEILQTTRSAYTSDNLLSRSDFHSPAQLYELSKGY